MGDRFLEPAKRKNGGQVFRTCDAQIGVKEPSNSPRPLRGTKSGPKQYNVITKTNILDARYKWKSELRNPPIRHKRFQEQKMLQINQIESQQQPFWMQHKKWKSELRNPPDRHKLFQ